jgi:hypothetical protein
MLSTKEDVADDEELEVSPFECPDDPFGRFLRRCCGSILGNIEIEYNSNSKIDCEIGNDGTLRVVVRDRTFLFFSFLIYFVLQRERD